MEYLKKYRERINKTFAQVNEMREEVNSTTRTEIEERTKTVHRVVTYEVLEDND